MLLTPVLSSNSFRVKDALENYFEMECVEKVVMEEQFSYITFKDVKENTKMMQFIHEHKGKLTFIYQNQSYHIETEYLDF